LIWDHKPKSPAVAGRRSGQRRHPLRGSIFALIPKLNHTVNLFDGEPSACLMKHDKEGFARVPLMAQRMIGANAWKCYSRMHAN